MAPVFHIFEAHPTSSASGGLPNRVAEEIGRLSTEVC
jgi:hypothetical protein